DRIGGEALLRELEGDARARRRLEEEVDDRLAAKHGDLLDRPLADLLERLRRVEDRADLLGGERLEPDQVLAQRGRRRLAHAASGSGVTSSTARRPSISGTSTSTRCPGTASTTRPVMSGWIGSSLPPRSTRTQR